MGEELRRYRADPLLTITATKQCLAVLVDA